VKNKNPLEGTVMLFSPTITNKNKTQKRLAQLREAMDDELMLTTRSEKAYELLSELEELLTKDNQ